jgi:cation diffusion facilitator family transporter
MASGSTKVVVAALLGNSAIAVTKFIASTITGSSAMFAEAIHSVVDTGNQGLLLLGIHRARRPADDRHPFGYGKEIYFWAFVVAIILFALGAGVSIYEGVHKIIDPNPITNVVWNYVVLGLAIAFEAGAWWIAYAEFDKVRGKTPIFRAVRQSKDPALFTVLFEDTAAILGLVTAFVGVFLADAFDLVWADGAATLVIGLILAAAAIFLAIETKGLLIGEGADEDLVADIMRITGRESFVERVAESRTLHFGPEDVLVTLSIDARDTATAAEVETGVSRLEAAIKSRHPEVTRTFIEIQSAKDTARQISEHDSGNASPNAAGRH